MKWLIVAAAAAAPVLATVPFIYMQVNVLARDSARASAEVVVGQVNAILSRTEALAAEAATYADRSCEAAGEVAARSAFYPYVRAVLLVRGKALHCPAAGGPPVPAEPLLAQVAAEPASAVHFVEAASASPGQAAVAVSRLDAGGNGAIVLVDGQYLQDLLDAVGSRGRYGIGIASRDGGHRIEGMDTTLPEPGAALAQEAASTAYPFMVRAVTHPDRRAIYHSLLGKSFLPFVLLLSALLGYGAYLLARYQFSMAAAIKRGMRRGEFEVYYQPLIRLGDGSVAGAEVLMRWFTPDRGPIRPDLFIAVAVDSGLIMPLTRHLFDLVCDDLRDVSLARGKRFMLGVNINADHLARPEIIDDVAGLRTVAGERGVDLVLEITERVPLPAVEQVYENMRRLNEQGIKLAIDDFGTGHSSLAYLEQFRVDHLKIDRGFVSAIGQETVNASVLQMILALAARLGVELIAEGVETDEQRDFLTRHGVHYGQGFLFAKPMPIRRFVEWMAQYEARQPGVPGGQPVLV